MKFAKGTLKSVYAVRFEPGEEIFGGLHRFCQENKIGHGVIISGVGSLRGCKFFDPTEMPNKPGFYGYGEPIELETPIELIALNGVICTEDDGKVSLHIHASFADQCGKEYGGHLCEGNCVLTTVELVIADFNQIYMRRGVDPERGVPVFTPTQE